MNNMNNIDALKRVLLPILLLIVIFGLIFGFSDDTKGFPDKKYGVPVVFYQESNMPHTSIDQIVEDGQWLYILFDKHEGTVQVYDLDGNYQYTLSFYSHMNGAFSIAAEGNVFYVRDEHQNLYLFRDGIFVSFTERESAVALTQGLDFGANSPNYIVRRASVWKVTGKKAVCVIRRPFYTVIYQNHLHFYITIGCIAVIAIAKRLYQVYRKQQCRYPDV